MSAKNIRNLLTALFEGAQMAEADDKKLNTDMSTWSNKQMDNFVYNANIPKKATNYKMTKEKILKWCDANKSLYPDSKYEKNGGERIWHFEKTQKADVFLDAFLKAFPDFKNIDAALTSSRVFRPSAGKHYYYNGTALIYVIRYKTSIAVGPVSPMDPSYYVHRPDGKELKAETQQLLQDAMK